jgi:NADP-dependent 3-hydroxy acid dehydrogenase YdfG
MSASSESQEIPEEFVKVIYDLINDILFTFPEFKEGLDLDLHNIKETRDEESVRAVYEHIRKVFPERFFDILYKNDEMFSKDDINTEFLPGIDFKKLWSSDVSEQTKDTIWKYLQLILFSVIGKVDSQDSFGDTAKLFEAINEDELKQKLEETMGNIQNMMNGMGAGESSTSTDSADNVPIDVTGIDMDKMPNPDDIQNHINGLFDGKLGNLAKEIAAETAEDLNIDMENATSVNDVFQNLFKNPGKLMGLVQNVGGKLDSKIKSGEIKESELMKEASDLLGKMKDMPGMGDIQSMLEKMGMGGALGGRGGGGGKLNLGAMTNKLNQDMKKAQTREKALQRATVRQAELEQIKKQQQMMAELPPTKQLTEAELEELVFSIEGDKPEKSMRNDNTANKKKKKKGKK